MHQRRRKSTFADYSHNDLIRYLAQHPDAQEAWEEFCNRFHELIFSVVIQTCQHLNYLRGLNELDDLVHNVYLKLLENDCHALKSYRGKYENSFLKYLRIISVRVVLLQVSQGSTQTRSPSGGVLSLDDPRQLDTDMRATRLIDMIPSREGETQKAYTELLEEVVYCLEKTTRTSRYPERDRLIFQLYLLDEYEVKQIVQFPGLGKLTEKRISNLISELKEKVRNCLEKRGIGFSARENRA